MEGENEEEIEATFCDICYNRIVYYIGKVSTDIYYAGCKFRN